MRVVPDDQIPKGWWHVMSIAPPAACTQCEEKHHSGWRRQKGDPRFLCDQCGLNEQARDEASKDEAKSKTTGGGLTPRVRRSR